MRVPLRCLTALSALNLAALAQSPPARDHVPADPGADFYVIPAARTEELTPANNWPPPESFRTWTRSLGGPTSNRFSALDQINKSNVAQLKLAWTYQPGDGTGNIQCNPIVVDGTMFAPIPSGHIVALNAATGSELWRFKPERKGNRQEDVPARRGLLYWPGDAEHAARVIFAAGNWIYALYPKTGQPVDSFGEGGHTGLPAGGTVAGAVFQHVLVVPGYLGDVFGYDVRNGELLWTFKTRPTGNELGASTWSRVEEGANCWGGMALDESRGIAYIATGSPKPNFFGSGHLGDNLFSNCVLALDARTGKRLWHFQEIRHDVWDWDIPAPPNLVTVEREGRRVDAVAQVTKLGNTLLLDRVSGQPLFPFRLRRVATRVLPGDTAALYHQRSSCRSPSRGRASRRMMSRTALPRRARSCCPWCSAGIWDRIRPSRRRNPRSCSTFTAARNGPARPSIRAVAGSMSTPMKSRGSLPVSATTIRRRSSRRPPARRCI
ncbi:MAG: quinoprotein glucose dehydrogenase [Chthoniobacter sp.]|jgi:glucose dehydrogenase|nr:quinoprotein glucose dehydrogenase [Chthoniobacter sp.]